MAVNFRTYYWQGKHFVKYDEISVLAGDLRVWSRTCTNCLATVTNGFSFSDHSIHTLRSLPGDVALTHDIEASTDMVHWKPVTDAVLYFKDPESANYDHRFYRFKQK